MDFTRTRIFNSFIHFCLLSGSESSCLELALIKYCWMNKCFNCKHTLLTYGYNCLVFLNLFNFNWRIIALQYCVGFCHTAAWISHRYTYVPSLWNLPPTSSNELDEPKACYTEWNKSEGEKEGSYINAYIWNLERRYWWTYLQGSNGDINTAVAFDLGWALR